MTIIRKTFVTLGVLAAVGLGAYGVSTANPTDTSEPFKTSPSPVEKPAAAKSTTKCNLTNIKIPAYETVLEKRGKPGAVIDVGVRVQKQKAEGFADRIAACNPDLTVTPEDRPETVKVHVGYQKLAGLYIKVPADNDHRVTFFNPAVGINEVIGKLLPKGTNTLVLE